jgi:polysaccharide pyruvyl transferase WcaK-like protein
MISRLLRKSKTAIKALFSDPLQFCKLVRKKIRPKPKKPIHADPILTGATNESDKTLTHIAFYTTYNAGDSLLPVTLRDLIIHYTGRKRWYGHHAHPQVSDSDVRKMNRTQGVIIGGGGLFLKDTNPNQNSGWQWNCSIEHLRKIRVPVAVFAVGYNRFRGQDDFSPLFRDHLNLLASKSAYIGLRNTGSIEAIKSYLAPELHHKVRFQPCMTTLCSKLYPQLTQKANLSRPLIALNVAFDRADLRFGQSQDIYLGNVAKAIKILSESADIQFISNHPSDEQMLPYLQQAKVPYQLVTLYHIGASQVVEAYSKPSLVIGMRGHAQMIPFGCQTPIISLVSHNKMRWFLDDINANDWGIEIDDADLVERLTHTAQSILSTREQTVARIQDEQDKLWKISEKNVRDLAAAFNLSTII